MRPSHAYLAGFGTAGSLLAGAAVVFVMATAVVGFSGWPTRLDRGSPSELAVNLPPLGGSRAARRLEAAAAGDRGRAADAVLQTARRQHAATVLVSHRAASGPHGHHGGSGGRSSYRSTSATGVGQSPTPRPIKPGAGAATGAPSAGGASPPCTTDCRSTSGSTVTKVVNTAKHGVDRVATGAGHTVDQTGKRLGATVKGVGDKVSAGVGQPAGGVVSKVGSAAGGVVSKVGSATGGLTSTLGGVVGGH